MFSSYTLIPHTTEAIHITAENYLEVAEWIRANVAEPGTTTVTPPSTTTKGRLRFSAPSALNRRHARVTAIIPGYIERITYTNGEVEYRSETPEMFESEWQPTN